MKGPIMANSMDRKDFVYCAYVVRNGKKVYPRKAKVFRFPKKKR